jgi:ribonuclease R
MHVKDLSDPMKKDTQVPVGDGKLPIVAIFRQLKKMNYQGGVMLEYEIDDVRSAARHDQELRLHARRAGRAFAHRWRARRSPDESASIATVTPSLRRKNRFPEFAAISTSLKKTPNARCTAIVWSHASAAWIATAAPRERSSACCGARTRPSVGELRLKRKGAFVVPHEDRIRQWIHIPEGMAIPPPGSSPIAWGRREIVAKGCFDLEGMIVNVEIVDFGEDGGRPVGPSDRDSRRPDDFGIDVEILIRTHHIPHRFPEDVLEQARGIPRADSGGGTGSAARFSRDGYRHHRRRNCARFRRCRVGGARGERSLRTARPHRGCEPLCASRGRPSIARRWSGGTSVYFPDRAVPMLPVELSTDQCSLRPNEDRLVLSALLEIDGRGDVVSQEFTRGVIRSVERMTYTAVHGILEGDAELRARYARLVDRFELMRELATILNRKRVRRGSIDFDLPEPLLEFDEFGEMTGVKRAPRNFAHRLIEEFMLAANEAVASHIETAGLPMIYRIHERPDPKRVLEFEEVAAQFGYSLVAGATPVKKFRETSVALDNPNLTSRSYQKLVAKIEGQARRADSQLPDVAVA